LAARAPGGKGNAHVDFRAAAASGFDMERAAHIGCSLAHSEQAKVLYFLSFARRLIGVETDPIVLDGQLDEGSLLRQAHGYVAGVSVFLHIVQGFLEDAIEG
jgi:hypothetical protein